MVTNQLEVVFVTVALQLHDDDVTVRLHHVIHPRVIVLEPAALSVVVQHDHLRSIHVHQ